MSAGEGGAVPSPLWPWARFTLAALAAGVVALVVLDRLGWGGLAGGPILVAGVAGAAVGLAAAWPALRLPSDGALWLAAAVAVALLAGVIVARRAPLSPARLGQRLDALHLPGRVDQRSSSGSVACGPCPSVREVRVADARREVAAGQLVQLLRSAGYAFRRARPGQRPDTVFDGQATRQRTVVRWRFEPTPVGEPARYVVVASSR